MDSLLKNIILACPTRVISNITNALYHLLRRSRTSSFIDIQMAEKSTEKSTEKTPKKSAPDTRENPLYLPAERPPPYSPPSYRP